MTVRIYMPTYRRPHLLPRALASLQAQTHPDWICEVHNDAPDDPTPAELIARLNDPRIRLVSHARNLGPTASFNLLFGPIEEPFRALLEDDNTWEPEFLTEMLAAANAHPEVAVLWANMRIAEESQDGTIVPTDRTVWPNSAEKFQLYRWGHPRQIGGAIHSNGAMLIRTTAVPTAQIPAFPFSIMEHCRERMLPHPLGFLSRPLANFTVTQTTSRSRDPLEWAECQALLVATFFHGCTWTHDRLAKLVRMAVSDRPALAGNLILAAIADPRVGPIARGVGPIIRLRTFIGIVRRRGLWRRLRRSRSTHPDWWKFLETHTARRWIESNPTQP